MTRSQIAELKQRQQHDQVSQCLHEQEQEQEKEMADLDLRGSVQQYAGVTYAAPTTFVDVSLQ